MKPEVEVRPSPIAGRWYPAEPGRLARSVDDYLQAANLPDIPGEVIAIMAPHAGHLYSGAVAGHAFATLRSLQPEVVAILSPMHYPCPEAVLTTAHSAYQTPLGLVPVDQEIVAALDENLQRTAGLGLGRVWNDREHSLEIELPFLQRALGRAPQAGKEQTTPFRLLPIMLRDQSERVARALGEVLARVLKNRAAVLVASTDLSHGFSQAQARILDAEMLRQVEAFDPAGVLRVQAEGRGYACGLSALAAMLWAALAMGADQARVLHYATSGDVSGDFKQVVGYAAAVITRPERPSPS
ncbi:MAG TPA: AmmeMemoRadiSam system protein B [Anaerolineales bacterium]|nr:AmmeMemoRadiSam system protein B [Anaerolineales bacterium]